MPDKLTASEVEELKRLDAAATQPPWMIDGDSPKIESPGHDICEVSNFIHLADECRANRDLIYKSRNALPALLRAWEERNKDRCSECNGELSACGDMTSDGPSMDCQTCLYNAALQDTKNLLQSSEVRAEAAERERDAARAECERLKEASDCIRLLSEWAGKTTPTPGLDEAIEAARETVDELLSTKEDKDEK